MKNQLTFLYIIFIFPFLSFSQISKYNVTKESYDIILSGSTGSNFELGSGVNMNIPSSPVATNVRAFNFAKDENSLIHNLDNENSNTIENSNFRIIDIKSSSELAENLSTYFKGSYKFASAQASYYKSKEIFESSESVLIIIENIKTGATISESSILWNQAPSSEDISIRTDEERLNQFLADYGSHYINSINKGYRIAIQGTINSKNSTEVETFKAAFKASFGQASGEGGASKYKKEILKDEKVEIRCEMTSGGVTPQHSTVLYGYEQIYDFLKKLKSDKIKILRGPISCSVKSYWHTLIPFQKTRLLLQNFSGYQSTAPYGVPAGTVISWYPSEKLTDEKKINNFIPDGWAVCNGGNGTPDLRERFIMGTDNLNNVNVIGGTKSHTHTFTQTAADLAPDASNDNNGSYANESEHLPPYLQLIYIMKL